MVQKIAVIFDMDGVVIDNNSYHELAWRKFCGKYNISISEEDMHNHVFGRISKDTLEYIFNRKLNAEEVRKFEREKEKIYQESYLDHIKEVSGLSLLLEELLQNEIPVALATSAPQENIDFIFRHLPLKKYFSFILNPTHIVHGKPNPEIYLKAVEQLGISAERCIVFEDSVSGILAAKAAGVKVVGLLTTHKAEELVGVERVVDNFEEINLDEVRKIINS